MSTRVAFAFSTTPDELEVLGAQSNAQGQASWKLVLQPGEIKTVDFVMAVGDVDAELIAKASEWAGDFSSVFAQAKDLWQGRFDDVFSPGNEHFSGNLPTLVTADHALSPGLQNLGVDTVFSTRILGKTMRDAARNTER